MIQLVLINDQQPELYLLFHTLSTVLSRSQELVYRQLVPKVLEMMSKLDVSTKMKIGGAENHSPSWLFRKGLLTTEDLDFREKT